MMMDVKTIAERAASVEQEIIQWRRHLHHNPELSFQERQTGQFVADALKSFGGIEVSRPVGHSVMGRILGTEPGKVLAIRADMDALPIHEDNAIEFASKTPGVMHACGHDGHTAMLLGTAKVLSQLKHRFNGEVRLLFQHAEELPPGGATEMVEAGVMNGVDMVIGTHLQTPLACGKIGVTQGEMMAAPDRFYITIEGVGGHAARPHDVVDSVAIASQVVTNLQHIVARNTDPLDSLVISVTQFHAGTAHNVIPNMVELQGTVRSFNPHTREIAPQTMERVIRGVTQAHGAEYKFKYERGYDPVINNDHVIAIVEDAACKLFGESAVAHNRKRMGGEDFSRFQAEAPGAFFDVGVGNESLGAIYPHHSSRFTIDESALINGVKMFLYIALNVLGHGETEEALAP